MGFNFGADKNLGSDIELIPNNRLAFGRLTVKEVKYSQAGSKYANIELVIQDPHPNQGRKVFEMIMDVTSDSISEKALPIHMANLQHMLETIGVFKPDEPASYERFNNSSFEEVLSALDGEVVAFKVKVEKGTEGYNDKNRVAAYLSPNPKSKQAKQWTALLAGNFGGDPVSEAKPKFGAAQQQTGFGFGGKPADAAQPAAANQPAAQATASKPAWLK